LKSGEGLHGLEEIRPIAEKLGATLVQLALALDS
jgi:hypothetical protein